MSFPRHWILSDPSLLTDKTPPDEKAKIENVFLAFFLAENPKSILCLTFLTEYPRLSRGALKIYVFISIFQAENLRLSKDASKFNFVSIFLAENFRLSKDASQI